MEHDNQEYDKTSADGTPLYDTGYTTGVFDLFHIGHLNLLQRARARCRRLLVGVSTDELVVELKGRKPVIPFEERIELVRGLKCVDEAVPETRDDKLAAWDSLRFDVILKGDDWKGSEKWNRLERDFARFGVSVVYLPYTKHTSSSRIRAIVERMDSIAIDE